MISLANKGDRFRNKKYIYICNKRKHEFRYLYTNQLKFNTNKFSINRELKIQISLLNGGRENTENVKLRQKKKIK